jgi:hypothetical protein
VYGYFIWLLIMAVLEVPALSNISFCCGMLIGLCVPLLPAYMCRFSIMFVKAVELLIPSKKKAAQGKIC